MLKNGACPECGGETYRNVGGLYLCLNSRGCGWRGYSLFPQPQPKLAREDQPGGELTSSQVYMESLQHIFGYESKMQIYRLRKRLGDIKVEATTSEPICCVTYYPSGGIQRLPVPIGAEDFQFVSGCPRIKEVRLHSALRHPRFLLNIETSGKPLAVDFYLKS